VATEKSLGIIAAFSPHKRLRVPVQVLVKKSPHIVVDNLNAGLDVNRTSVG
jgi:hypothetical protein